MSSNPPLISIITPVYNGSKTIEKTIESVTNQTFLNYEFIIVDGKSTDNTLDIIERYRNNKFTIISEKDSGIYDAMNKGIDVSKGNFILFLGADDYLKEDILSKIENELTMDRKVIFGNIQYIEGNKFISSVSKKTLIVNTIHHQSAFYNRSLFTNFRYRTDLKLISDYELNLDLYLHKMPYKYIDTTISYVTQGGESQNIDNFDIAMKEHREIRKKALGISVYFWNPLATLWSYMIRRRLAKRLSATNGKP